MKKNNKGFTLIELLAAVAIILTILGIAIVNFINISDRKKEEAWESVKSEIEIAAEQYFKSNEFLFEGIDTTGQITGNVGKISVGTLVSSDYLNVIADPRSGKKVSYCMLVEVTKDSNGVFKTKIVDNNENTFNGASSGCDETLKVETMVSGAPSISITYSGAQKKEGSEWYTGDVTANVTIKDDAAQIVNSAVCGTPADKCTPSTSGKLTLTNHVYKKTHTADTAGYKYCAYAQNAVGGKTTMCGTVFKKDTVAPNFNIGMYKKTSTSDVTSSSGLSSYTSDDWYNKGIFTKVQDRSDNYSSVNQLTTTYTTTGKTTNVTNQTGTYRNINAEGSSTIKYKVCDLAGNCREKTGNVKLDQTAPKPTVSIKSALSNYNSNVVNVSLSATDEASGLTTITYSDRIGTTSYDGKKQKTWSSSLNNRSLFSGLSSTESRKDTGSLVAYDAAGNSSKGESQYSVYQLCSKKKETITYGSWSGCSATCGGGTKTRTVTKNYTDSNTGGSCGSSTGDSEKQSCNTQACTKSCPKITVNGTSGSNTVSGVTWYRGDSIRFNHDGESGYWAWYRGTTDLGSTSNLLSKSEGIYEGKYTYKLIGQAGEECPYVYGYDNTAPSCPTLSVKSGTIGNNDWYRSNVTVKFDKSSDIAKWDWRSSYAGSEETKSNSATTEYTINKDTNQGQTALAINVYDTLGNVNRCSWEYYKIDTVAPTLNGVSNTTLTHQMYTDSSLNQKVFEGEFNISRSGNTYKGTICLKNIVDGAFRVNGIQGSWSDNASGISSYTNNDSWFIDKDGNKVSRCRRTGSPCQYQFGMTVTDNAGNSADFVYVDMYAGYILKKDASNFSEPCYVDSYTKRYSKIIFDDTNWNINLNVK